MVKKLPKGVKPVDPKSTLEDDNIREKEIYKRLENAQNINNSSIGEGINKNNNSISDKYSEIKKKDNEEKLNIIIKTTITMKCDQEEIEKIEEIKKLLRNEGFYNVSNSQALKMAIYGYKPSTKQAVIMWNKIKNKDKRFSR
jgi:hypothetical protein